MMLHCKYSAWSRDQEGSRRGAGRRVTMSNEEARYPGTRWLVLLAYALCSILFEICALSISPLSPQIAQNLNVDLGTVAGLMSSFLLGGTIAMLVAGGPACDKLGILWALTLSAFFFTLPMSLAP